VRRALAAFALLGLAGAAALARAQTAPPRQLPYDLTVDGTITGAAIVYWIGSEALRPQLAPSTCHWCDPPGFDSSARDALRWSDTNAANITSYVTALGVAPLAVFGLDAWAAHRDQAEPGAAWIDALLISESVSVAMAMNQTVKFIVGRERPFVHALPEADKPNTAHPSDNNLSFYSGHATFTFALAAAGGTVASMRRYRMAPCIWATGMIVAAGTAYLRIAADKHYLSDVTVGAVIGSATGFAGPYLFHHPGRLTVAPAPLEHGGAVLTVRGLF
jgi:membrane-associated phospholipid phosphatase